MRLDRGCSSTAGLRQTAVGGRIHEARRRECSTTERTKAARPAPQDRWDAQRPGPDIVRAGFGAKEERGLASMRRRAICIPALEVRVSQRAPFVRTRRSGRMSASVTGRRYALRASVSGSTTRSGFLRRFRRPASEMRLRDGVRPLRRLYGPRIVIPSRCGRPAGFKRIHRTANKRLQTHGADAPLLDESRDHLCRPAFTGMRIRKRASIASEPSVGLRIFARSSGPPIVAQENALAVDRQLHLMRVVRCRA